MTPVVTVPIQVSLSISTKSLSLSYYDRSLFTLIHSRLDQIVGYVKLLLLFLPLLLVIVGVVTDGMGAPVSQGRLVHKVV